MTPKERLSGTSSDPSSSAVSETPTLAGFQTEASDLVGRDREIEILRGAFDRICGEERRGSGIVMVRGNSGTGKTTLINALRDHIEQADNGAVFCHGKFDLMVKNTPYYALIDAFTEFIEKVLLSPDLKEREARVQEAVGAEGAVLKSFLPGAVDLLGDSVRSKSLGNTESLNKFRFILREFIKALCTPSHPVVVFVDDLQWSDQQSLDLIHTLLTDSELTNFLFVGCYRDNEVLPHHPLELAMTAIEAERANYDLSETERILVENLDSSGVNELLSNVLDMEEDVTKPLADVVHEKT